MTERTDDIVRRTGSTPGERPDAGSWAAVLSAIFFHLVAITAIASVSAALFMGNNAVEALRASLDMQLHVQAGTIIATHIGACTAAWGVVYVVVTRLLRRPDQDVSVIKLTRGTVMTETLIVLPVLLLLVSGLAQLSMLSMAGLLANLAGYNAGRAVWVWDAQDVSDEECEKKALEGAAHAVAPSVPDDYVGASGSRSAESESVIFARAYDTGSDVEGRAPGKLAFARESIDIEIIRESDRVGAETTYWFNIVFPWFQYLWGEKTTRGDREGIYSPLKRSYTLPAQLR